MDSHGDLQGFYKNDFTGLTFENGVAGGTRITGESILKDTFQVTGFSKWIDLAILVGMAVLYRILFFGLIKLKEKLAPIVKDMLSGNAAPKASSDEEKNV
jgi:hypothetical protein